jgi:phosphatidylinositol alpha-1,6-mannosyltransferase
MLENSARQLRITHKIVFAGRVSHDELPDYLAISEIFAMPVRSRFSGLEVEGLGIVYLEVRVLNQLWLVTQGEQLMP